MPVPGPQTIFKTLGKVQLALKMKKSPLLEYYFYKGERSKFNILDNITDRSSSRSYPHVQDFYDLYEIFLERKFTPEEIRKGVDFAVDFVSSIQSNRESLKEQRLTKKNRKSADRLFNKINDKIDEVYRKREIPKFSRKTGGTIIYLDKIIIENEMDTFINNHSGYSISAFKFKDKNGMVSLNFYAPKPTPSRYRNSRRYR